MSRCTTPLSWLVRCGCRLASRSALNIKVIRGQDVCDQVLDSVDAGDVSEPPKQNGSYSAQVIVVCHNDSDLRGCRVYRKPGSSRRRSTFRIQRRPVRTPLRRRGIRR